MFNLTAQERQVLLFLSTVALIGLGINFWLKSCAEPLLLAKFSRQIVKIDLNSADMDLLMSISGIGQKLAARIIAYRANAGGFKDLEELKKIKGISGYRYEKIKDSLLIK